MNTEPPQPDTRIQLLPCPLCGGEAEVVRLGTARVSMIVRCTNCGCRQESGDRDHYAGSTWNSRRAQEEHPHTSGHLYLYTINPQGRATFERSMPRQCVTDAICRILELKKQKREAFYIPGMTLPWGFH